MNFKKYQHIERLGTDKTEGILNGECHIFPKLDGMNCQIWYNEQTKRLHAGSRNQELSPKIDNRNFLKWVKQQENILKCLQLNPTIRLYGEWLVPHHIKAYHPAAWNNFYIFDVILDDKYLTYEHYSKLLDSFKITYIPILQVINNPTQEQLKECINKNNYLLENNLEIGEGIIIKNYEYINKYGNKIWAKIVTDEFLTNKSQKQIQTNSLEEQIINHFLTTPFLEKELAKLEENKTHIPKFLGIINNVFIQEEIWNIIKKYKYPTIDFKKLQQQINHVSRRFIMTNPNRFIFENEK